MKIKIDKKIWLIMAAVIIIVAVVILARTYTEQAREQRQLETNLAMQQGLLQQLINQENDQQDRLNAAESLFETSRARYPESVESIEYGEDLFEIADDCNVELINLSPLTPRTATAGAVAYSVSTFTIVAQGDVNAILDFIDALRTGDGFRQAWSAEVTGVSIDFGDVSEVATISVDIYGYRG
jgi:hypothetical protein